ncbi:HNH endonuclease family protein [Kitasatospora sp. MBT63]|uniref:HNH endonuclease family protein n=1 Tax=Kitasatospora sp. MBT63 TaxID=1444768 RepID=UPI000ACD7859|nr:HNH endonuclease family protein [Kitasatospora sp. MBT63]
MRTTAITRAAITTAAALLLTTAAANPASATSAAGAGAHREAGQAITLPLDEAIEQLTVADEDRTGYVRTAFKHWVDADKDGCDARKEVIKAEALEPPVQGPRCALTGGLWLSLYDDVVVTDAGRLDVDHLVPLAEAWDSGASNWSAKEREVYANDLLEPRALIAVTAASNRSKADKDPADWLTPAVAYRCTYLNDWVAIKTRWNLSIDAREHQALTDIAAGCPDDDITVAYAR